MKPLQKDKSWSCCAAAGFPVRARKAHECRCSPALWSSLSHFCGTVVPFYLWCWIKIRCRMVWKRQQPGSWTVNLCKLHFHHQATAGNCTGGTGNTEHLKEAHHIFGRSTYLQIMLDAFEEFMWTPATLDALRSYCVLPHCMFQFNFKKSLVFLKSSSFHCSVSKEHCGSFSAGGRHWFLTGEALCCLHMPRKVVALF